MVSLPLSVYIFTRDRRKTETKADATSQILKDCVTYVEYRQAKTVTIYDVSPSFLANFPLGELNHADLGPESKISGDPRSQAHRKAHLRV